MLRRIIVALLAVQAALLEAHFGFGHYAPMAVVFIEGFDFYSSTTLIWGAAATIKPGRYSGPSQSQAILLGASTYTRALPSSYSEVYLGFAFQSGGSSSTDTMTLRAGATNVCRVGISGTNGVIQIRNSAGTVIASGTTALTVNTWFFVEVHFVVGTTGSVTVHINGNPEIATTTGNFGTSNVDTLAMVGAANMQIDDIFILDTTGTDNNTFLGDRQVITAWPDGDGAHTAWTPTGGGSHYTEVDDLNPDNDTTYVASAVVGAIDTYTFQDIDAAATVNAVQINRVSRKDDSNARQLAGVIRQASTDYVGTTDTMTASYVYYRHIWDKDPTGADWTAANVNADEFGVKVIA